MFQIQSEDGKWVLDEEQTVRLKADFVISAFGSELQDESGEGWDGVRGREMERFGEMGGVGWCEG